jgi:DNA-binding transcriptional MerR regulator
MQQLDLFDNGSGKKVAVIKPKQHQEINRPAINQMPQPGIALQQPEEKTSEKNIVQLIKPFSKEVEQPAKRGRKSLKEINLDVGLLDIPDDETLARKQYYPISEVAEWFNMKPSLLRFWENEFDILKPRKNKKGDRLFRPEDIKNLRIIYYLLRQQKFSIEGAKQYLKDNKKKAEMQVQLVESLTKFRSFLFELRANLGA